MYTNHLWGVLIPCMMSTRYVCSLSASGVWKKSKIFEGAWLLSFTNDFQSNYTYLQDEIRCDAQFALVSPIQW